MKKFKEALEDLICPAMPSAGVTEEVVSGKSDDGDAVLEWGDGLDSECKSRDPEAEADAGVVREDDGECATK